MDDSGLTSVAGLEKLTQLQTLYLDNNQLTSVDGLEKLTQLQTLNLENNQLASVATLHETAHNLAISPQISPDIARYRQISPDLVLTRCSDDSARDGTPP